MASIKMYTCRLADRTPFGKSLLAITCFYVHCALFRFEVAVLLFLGLVIHELGHARAAKRHSISVRGIYLFPWLAGLCSYGERVRSWQIGTYLTFMGPIYTLLFSSLLFVSGTIMNSGVLLFGAFAGGSSTIWNLIPGEEKDGKKLVTSFLAPSPRSGLHLRERLMILFLYLALLTLSFVLIYSSFRSSFILKPELFFSSDFVNILRSLGCRAASLIMEWRFYFGSKSINVVTPLIQNWNRVYASLLSFREF